MPPIEFDRDAFRRRRQRNMLEGLNDPFQDSGGSFTSVGIAAPNRTGRGPEQETFRGEEDLMNILDRRFGSELDRLRGRQPSIERAFLRGVEGRTDIGNIRSELQNIAGAVGEELFRPGGQVEQATRGALGESVRSGFGTASGGFDRARMNILGQAREGIERQVAQQGAQLAQVDVQDALGRLGELRGFTQNQAALANDLAQSLFGGRATIEQLRDSRRALEARLQEMGCGVGERIGSGVAGGASGAATGTMIAPGVGTAIGAGAGLLSGLLSGC